MYQLSEYKEKVLNKAHNYWQKGSLNPLYVQWREEAIFNNKFYDGKNHWPEHLVNLLRQRGQDPIVLNKLKPIINNICGIEVNTKSKFAYRIHSNKNEEELLAKALTHWGFYVQENQNFSYKGSLSFKDKAKIGLGWNNMYFYKGKTYYEYTNPLNMVYDADDFSPQLENQEFLCNMRFLSNERLNLYWPKYKKQFEEINPKNNENVGTSTFSSELYNLQSAWLSPIMEGLGLGNRLPVVEVQYRETKKYYSGIDKSGHYFCTFDEEKAEELAESKNDIEEEMGTQIMRTVFYQNLLLDHSPLYPNIPNRKDFSYIPQVWDRRSSDSIPVGVIEDLKDLQREINYRKAKELQALNSARAVISADAFTGQSQEEVRDEIARSDGLIIKNRDSTVDIIPNIDMAASHMKAAERNDRELQQISGVFSDSLGEPTNAQSGIAIKERQIGTSRNFSSPFSSIQIFKKREGQALLDILQGGENENLLVQILDDDEMDSIILNLVREVNGKKVIFNDVRTLPIDVYVEQVPDYESSPEEVQAIVKDLLATPNGIIFLQNPQLLKLLRLRDWDKISSSMQQLQQQQMAMEQQAQGNGQMQFQPNKNTETINPVQLGQM